MLKSSDGVSVHELTLAVGLGYIISWNPQDIERGIVTFKALTYFLCLRIRSVFPSFFHGKTYTHIHTLTYTDSLTNVCNIN